MGTRTGIEWTDSTWSPIRVRVKADAAEIARAKGYSSLVAIAEKMAGHVGSHCEHVSPGCEHCYAETNNHRCLPANGTGLPYDRRSRDLLEAFVDEKILLQPLRWGPGKKSVRSGVDMPWKSRLKLDVIEERPRRIFVENQSDLFGEWVTDEMLDRVFAVMALCPQHVFQVLTKRPERMLAYLKQVSSEKDMQRWVNAALSMETLTDRYDAELVGELIDAMEFPLPNVWLGVSAEDQATADARIQLLLQTPAAVRFISAEPLLGPIDLTVGFRVRENVRQDALYGSEGLRWVICGGESGPGARPMHPDWARSLRDQCVAAGVPFFFKQWGAYKNGSDFQRDAVAVLADGRVCDGTVGELTRLDINKPVSGAVMMRRVGKKAAGALLDGREWKEFPR